MDDKKDESTVMDNNKRMRESKRCDEVSQGERWQRDDGTRGRDSTHKEREEEKEEEERKL
jgi:hypothetical protein